MIDLRPRRSWESDDAALFRESLRGFLADNVPQNDMRWRAQKFVDPEFWRATGALGFLCPSMPLDYGGSGGDFTFEAVAAEEFTYADTSSCIGFGVHSNIVAHYILAYGTEAQKQLWLPRMCSGELIGAIGMTEPGGGSDLRGMRTMARRDGDDYVISGSKIFITNGQVAGLIVLAAKTDAERGGISLIVMETEGLKGFARGRNLHKIGMHGSDTAELFFDEVRIPAANLLGEENKGLRMMMQKLPQERIGIACGAQAMLERAIELGAEYVAGRKAFGKTLLEQQTIRHKLAECLMEARVSRAFTDECIAKQAAGVLTSAEASMAKYWTTERAGWVIDACLQMHGGYGYMEEYPIARLYADARVQRIYGGANEIMKELIAREFG